MKFYNDTVTLRTNKRLEIMNISKKINDSVSTSGIDNGLMNLWINHTTAALVINEDDPNLWEDIISTFKYLVPVDTNYNHNRRYSHLPGEQNAHAHILNCLIKPDTTIPIKNKKIMLSTWQNILFIELDGPRERSVNIQIMGE